MRAALGSRPPDLAAADEFLCEERHGLGLALSPLNDFRGASWEFRSPWLAPLSPGNNAGEIFKRLFRSRRGLGLRHRRSGSFSLRALGLGRKGRKSREP